MYSKKFFMFCLICLVPSMTSCMKAISKFLSSGMQALLHDETPVETVLKKIDKAKNNELLNEYDKNSQLADLYGQLYKKYIERENYNKENAQSIIEEQKKFAKAAADIEQIEKLEEKIEQQINIEEKERSVQWAESLSSNIKELLQFCPDNQGYVSDLVILENLKQRYKLEAEIEKLKETNNKKDLIVAYKGLRDTYYSKEDQKPFEKIVFSLENEVAEEEKACEEKKIKDNQLRKERLETLNQNKIYLLNNKSLSPVKCKMQLAGIYDETAQLYSRLSDTQSSEYETKKARELRLQALALAKQTKDSAAEEQLLKLLTS
jgi:hypothetical protein